jgi:hypothetical protein
MDEERVPIASEIFDLVERRGRMTQSKTIMAQREDERWARTREIRTHDHDGWLVGCLPERSPLMHIPVIVSGVVRVKLPDIQRLGSPWLPWAAAPNHPLESGRA